MLNSVINHLNYIEKHWTNLIDILSVLLTVIECKFYNVLQ